MHRVPGQLTNAGCQRDALPLQTKDFRVLQDAHHEVSKEAGIVDIAVQHPRDVALVEDTLLARDKIQHDGRIGLDTPGVFLAPPLLELETFIHAPGWSIAGGGRPRS